MGLSQSKVQNFTRTDTNGKSYAIPVALPPHKVHSSTSSLNTLADSADHEDLNNPKAVNGRFYLDDEDNFMFTSLLEDYECGQILGKGSSAQVFEVIHKATQKKYACKVVHKNNSINDSETMRVETEILLRMNHKNISKLHELYETTFSKWYIMELANGGLLQTALAAEENYTEEFVATHFKQVLEGMKYLHEIGIVHRDLKQDNILCTVTETASGQKQYEAKIADFGLSALAFGNHLTSAKSMKKYKRLKEMWGTKEYLAPEVYKKAYGPQVDVWSLGCVLYELLTGEVPFPTREKEESKVERVLLNGGKKAKRHFESLPQWQTLSPEAKDLIHHMLKTNPSKRYNIQECLNHPFILRTEFATPGSSKGGTTADNSTCSTSSSMNSLMNDNKASASSALNQHAGTTVISATTTSTTTTTTTTTSSEGNKFGVLSEAQTIARRRAAGKLARMKVLVDEAEKAMKTAARAAGSAQ